MSDRTVGYILLSVGVFIMFLSLVQSYFVFTGMIKPPMLFKAQATTPAVSQPPALGSQIPGLGSGTTTMPTPDMGALLGSLFGGASMTDMLNLSMYGFLLFLVQLFGYKLASLGMMMLRPITVKLKSKVIGVEPIETSVGATATSSSTSAPTAREATPTATTK